MPHAAIAKIQRTIQKTFSNYAESQTTSYPGKREEPGNEVESQKRLINFSQFFTRLVRKQFTTSRTEIVSHQSNVLETKTKTTD